MPGEFKVKRDPDCSMWMLRPNRASLQKVAQVVCGLHQSPPWAVASYLVRRTQGHLEAGWIWGNPLAPISLPRSPLSKQRIEEEHIRE